MRAADRVRTKQRHPIKPALTNRRRFRSGLIGGHRYGRQILPKFVDIYYEKRQTLTMARSGLYGLEVRPGRLPYNRRMAIRRARVALLAALRGQGSLPSARVADRGMRRRFGRPSQTTIWAAAEKMRAGWERMKAGVPEGQHKALSSADAY
jgi:hypothetical protein